MSISLTQGAECPLVNRAVHKVVREPLQELCPIAYLQAPQFFLRYLLQFLRESDYPQLFAIKRYVCSELSEQGVGHLLDTPYRRILQRQGNDHQLIQRVMGGCSHADSFLEQWSKPFVLLHAADKLGEIGIKFKAPRDFSSKVTHLGRSEGML